MALFQAHYSLFGPIKGPLNTIRPYFRPINYYFAYCRPTNYYLAVFYVHYSLFGPTIGSLNTTVSLLIVMGVLKGSMSFHSTMQVPQFFVLYILCEQRYELHGKRLTFSSRHLL